MTESTHYHMKPIKQLLYLLAVCAGCIIIGNVLCIGVIAGLYGKETIDELQYASASSPQYLLNAYKIALVLGTTIASFLAPAVFFAYLIVRDPDDYLRTIAPKNAFQPLIGLVIMLAATPLLEYLVLINQEMVFPDALKGVERWMRDSETANGNAVKTVLQVDTPFHVAVSLIIGAVLPAIAEEFLFRGSLQTILQRWTQSAHAAVWISAFIFSALHFQFFGFLPRLMLGALFGYLVVWSGSIWPAVLAHFLNNGLAVIGTYLYQNKKINIDPDSEKIFNYPAYIASLLIVLFLLWIYKSIASGKRLLPR